MRTIKCSAEGCNATCNVFELSAPDVKYTCREHTPKNEDKTRFQSHQFDRQLSNASQAVGVLHIPNIEGRPKIGGTRPSRALKNPEGENA